VKYLLSWVSWAAGAERVFAIVSSDFCSQVSEPEMSDARMPGRECC